MKTASASLINSRSECSPRTCLYVLITQLGVNGGESLSIPETVWGGSFRSRSRFDHPDRQGNYSITILAAYLAQIPIVLDELRRNELYGQIDDRDAEALAEEDELAAPNNTPREGVNPSDRVRPRDSLFRAFLTSRLGHHSHYRQLSR